MNWICIGEVFFATLAVGLAILIVCVLVKIGIDVTDKITYDFGFRQGYKKAMSKCGSAAKDAYFNAIDEIFHDLKIDNDYGSRFSWYNTFLNTFKNKTDEN